MDNERRLHWSCSVDLVSFGSTKFWTLQKPTGFFAVLLSPVLNTFEWLLSLCIVHALSNAAVIKSQPISWLRIEPGQAGWETWTLPLCYPPFKLTVVCLILVSSNFVDCKTCREPDFKARAFQSSALFSSSSFVLEISQSDCVTRSCEVWRLIWQQLFRNFVIEDHLKRNKKATRFLFLFLSIGIVTFFVRPIWQSRLLDNRR